MDLNGKLQVIYEHFLRLRKTLNDEPYEKSFAKKFFDQMLETFGYENKPTILKNSAYKKINSQPLFHGFEKFEFGVSFLKDDIYWTGDGYTNGFYAAAEKSVAFNYTGDDRYFDLKKSLGKILEFKIASANRIHAKTLSKIFDAIWMDSDIKLDVDILEKLRILLSFIENISDERYGKEFLSLMTYSSNLAIFLGKDFIFDSDGYTIVLNRGVICVKDSELSRFISLNGLDSGSENPNPPQK